MKIGDAHGPLLSEEADKLLDEDAIKREAVELAEQDGIVFLDEIQGRLPIRVELRALTEEDFVRILTEPEASLIKQYKALMATEDVTLDFTTDGIAEIATISAEVNASIENIGARRLHTVMERLLDDISFKATDKSGETVTVDKAYVKEHVGTLAADQDLSKFIL